MMRQHPHGWTFEDMTKALATAADIGEYLGKVAAADLFGFERGDSMVLSERELLDTIERARDEGMSEDVIEKFAWTLAGIVRSVRSCVDEIEGSLVKVGLAPQPLPDPDTVVIPDTVPVDWS